MAEEEVAGDTRGRASASRRELFLWGLATSFGAAPLSAHTPTLAALLVAIWKGIVRGSPLWCRSAAVAMKLAQVKGICALHWA